MNQQEKKNNFSTILLEWFSTNARSFPWKETKDPYLIWLSEIILQQTRVDQGLAYYQKFSKKYPTVKKLANTSNDELMKLWEGLGYYSRARNLHLAAKYIVEECDSIFPNEYKKILKLKGVGPYTAAAISSFAFDLPHAVVDGNVYRVLSRYFGINAAIDSTKGKKIFSTLAQQLLTKNSPGTYNQALMDFGSIQCSPKKPSCSDCPFQLDCFAFQNNEINNLPRKEKKIKKRTRYFNFIIINNEEEVFLQKRTEKDIWRDLYQFPLIENEVLINSFEELKAHKNWEKNFPQIRIELNHVSQIFKQVLTHQTIIAQFWQVQISDKKNIDKLDFIKVLRKNLKTFAFPKIIDKYLQDEHQQQLNLF